MSYAVETPPLPFPAPSRRGGETDTPSPSERGPGGEVGRGLNRVCILLSI